jgi:hypothetical protein
MEWIAQGSMAMGRLLVGVVVGLVLGVGGTAALM